ncbi:MAG: carboxypeptidase regulatory-like domain-containing protein [Bacteroidales bacterium]|nr:carboxypeptidase regulatory-like domain-containing protein [Bacteroidales bacterium]
MKSPIGFHEILLILMLVIPYSTSLAQEPSADPLTDLLPATLTGVISNGQNGNPIIGARISIWPLNTNNDNLSVIGGQYTVAASANGLYTVMVTKAGYQGKSIPNVSLLPGNTTVLNISLLPEPYPVSNLNVWEVPSQTAVDIYWDLPVGNYEIIYDDGIQEDFLLTQYPYTRYAVKFNPQAYPVTVKGGKVNVGELSNYPNGVAPSHYFQIQVMDATGPGGMPGNCKGTYWIDPLPSPLPPDLGWIPFSGVEATFTSGPFYLVMYQETSPTNAYGIAIDNTVNQLRSFTCIGSSGNLWLPVGGNLMLRADVWGRGGPLPPLDGTIVPEMTSGFSTTGSEPDLISGYRVWRLHPGEELDPAAWTLVWTTTNTNVVDNAWATLPCGLYRWAVEAIYQSPSGAYFSDAVFSHALEKCWTTPVTVNLHACCPGVSSGKPIQLHHLSYDTTFIEITDTNGTAHFQEVWKGPYHLDFAMFTCSQYCETFTITGDTTIDIYLSYAPADPTEFSVDDQSLLSTWKAPYHQIIDFTENWNSGNFTANQWTVSGGINWVISAVTGNPQPSAMFYSSPHTTNYNQSLTTKPLYLGYAPKTEIQYDIFLDNYGTTTENSMAVEVWDGAAWTTLRSYSNQGGNIPWTSELLDISSLSGRTIKLRFRATGADSYDINSWNVDNIKITERDLSTCVLGYNLYINNVLSGITLDTFYQFPTSQLLYGQNYTACVEAVFTGSSSQLVCDTFTCNYLTPPTNLIVEALECSAYLVWDKPKLMSGTTPPGLIGYAIYRDSIIVHYNVGPDALEYYDLHLDPGLYQYGVSAIYDLTLYGFPGQNGESAICDAPEALNVVCGDALPFEESWTNGTFWYNEWEFEPSPGNWSVSVSDDGEAPYADFSWDTIRTNYSYSLISRTLNASAWTCADLWFDFEYQLIDRYSGGTEKLAVDIFYDKSWHPLIEYVNNASVEWKAMHISIDSIAGKAFFVRFVASGENSSNIFHWSIDNIHLYGLCRPPLNPEFTTSGQAITLTWTAPGCGNVAGYNIYRTDSSGSPPFFILNELPITETTYTDIIPAGWSALPLKYYFTTTFNEPDTAFFLCESVSSDTLTVDLVTTPELQRPSIVIYPNPTTGITNYELRIAKSGFVNLSLVTISGIEVADVVCKDLPSGNHTFTFDATDIPAGVYLHQLRIDGTLQSSGKLVIIH